jgi:copper resistance protein B
MEVADAVAAWSDEAALIDRVEEHGEGAALREQRSKGTFGHCSLHTSLPRSRQRHRCRRCRHHRWISSFWNAQIGVQYANEWAGDNYRDRWSGVLALQGLAPGKFEIDTSLYISDNEDVTVEFEGEYNLRLTQRLVLQPRAELGFAAQEVSNRQLGAGMTDATLDLRLRYEIRRELAPYIGARYRGLVGDTRSRADDNGRDEDVFFFMTGLRLAF